MTLTIGQAAPDFEVLNQHGEKTSLSSFKGEKNVVLLFYPFAFSGICTGELCALRDDLAAFQNDNVELLAISCDPMYAQRAFAEAEGYKFPVLAEERGSVKVQDRAEEELAPPLPQRAHGALPPQRP